jgi:hypothetical protein
MRGIVLLLIAGGLIAQPVAIAHPNLRPQQPTAARVQSRPPPGNRYQPAAQKPQPFPQSPSMSQSDLAPQEHRPDISPGDAAHRAQEANGGGRVLAVDPMQQGYRVKLLKDGEVRAVQIPPNQH